MHGELPQHETKTQAAQGRGAPLCWSGALVLIAVGGALYYVVPARRRRSSSICAASPRSGPVPVLAAHATRADVPVYLERRRHRAAAQHRDRAPAGRRQADQRQFQGRPGRQEGRRAGAASIPPSTRRSSTRRWPRRRRTRRSSPMPSNDLARYEKLAATNAINKQQADTQKALVAQYAALVAGRPGGDRERAARRSATPPSPRRSPAAPASAGRRRQYRARLRQRIGHRHHHPAQADRGAVQPAAAGPDAGERGLRQGPAAGRRAALRRQHGDRAAASSR